MVRMRMYVCVCVEGGGVVLLTKLPFLSVRVRNFFFFFNKWVHDLSHLLLPVSLKDAHLLVLKNLGRGRRVGEF